MIEEILMWPIELKIIIGTGFTLIIYELGRENGIWGKQQQDDHQSKKYWKENWWAIENIKPPIRTSKSILTL